MTTTENRPSLAPKRTASTEKRRTAALDEGIRIVAGDEVYEIRVGDLNALHERALRREYGVPFMSLIDEVSGEAPGLDSIAAVIWLTRYMRGETTLTYDEVAIGIDLEFAETMELDGAEPEEVGDNPEA